MKTNNYKFTLEDKIEELKESIVFGGMEDYDMNLTEEELEADNYMELFYAQKIGVKGYENSTYDDLNEMKYEDIINIYNEIHGTEVVTLKQLYEVYGH